MTMNTIKTRKGTLRHQQSTCIHMRNKMLISELKIQLKSFKRFERNSALLLERAGGSRWHQEAHLLRQWRKQTNIQQCPGVENVMRNPRPHNIQRSSKAIKYLLEVSHSMTIRGDLLQQLCNLTEQSRNQKPYKDCFHITVEKLVMTQARQVRCALGREQRCHTHKVSGYTNHNDLDVK